MQSNSNTYGYANGITDGNSNAERDGDVYSYSDSDGYLYAYGNSDSYTHTHADPDGHTHSYAHTYADPNPDALWRPDCRHQPSVACG